MSMDVCPKCKTLLIDSFLYCRKNWKDKRNKKTIIQCPCGHEDILINFQKTEYDPNNKVKKNE